jgi:hypothetical protein
MGDDILATRNEKVHCIITPSMLTASQPGPTIRDPFSQWKKLAQAASLRSLQSLPSLRFPGRDRSDQGQLEARACLTLETRADGL